MKRRKKAGIYDRWLHSLGGGEQVAFAYAAALRDLGYQTEILTHRKVDLEQAKLKMNVDLTGITVRYIPNLLDFQLSSYSEGYDVFVCNSYLDYIPNRSKFGILSVFFPSRVRLFIYEYLKRAYIVPSLRRFFIYPSQFEGFRYDEYLKRRIYKWLGSKSIISFSDNIREFSIGLFFENLAISLLGRITFQLDDVTVKPFYRAVSVHSNVVTYKFRVSNPTKGMRFVINLPESEFAEGVALVRIVIPGFRYFLYNTFKNFFPRLEMRLHGGPSVTKFSDIESYDKILTISRFSRRWVKNYWGLDSEVLYPPATTSNFKPSKRKKNMIAHIGRFFVTGHSKKQLDLVRVFKTLVDQGINGWELHFIGSVADGDAHHRYLESCKEEAVGYPIFFHINAPFHELRRILSDSKIYWHATGLDEDADKRPIRLEHFGITTVEAMASGCVPVVLDLGGQSEIVTDESGYRWRTRAELVKYTRELIKNQKLLEEKSKNAVERSRFFSFENFKRELAKYLPKDK